MDIKELKTLTLKVKRTFKKIKTPVLKVKNTIVVFKNRFRLF